MHQSWMVYDTKILVMECAFKEIMRLRSHSHSLREIMGKRRLQIFRLETTKKVSVKR